MCKKKKRLFRSKFIFIDKRAKHERSIFPANLNSRFSFRRNHIGRKNILLDIFLDKETTIGKQNREINFLCNSNFSVFVSMLHWSEKKFFLIAFIDKEATIGKRKVNFFLQFEFINRFRTRIPSRGGFVDIERLGILIPSSDRSNVTLRH